MQAAEKPFACPTAGCTRRFGSAFGCRQHLIWHTGEKPFECSYADCGAAFAYKSALVSHVRRHTGEKPHRCTAEGCTDAFATSGELRSHTRTHSGEKPHRCGDCTYTCSTSGALKVHRRIHTAEKPFKCTVPDCRYSASVASSVQSHMATHTGDRPHKCDKCDRAFTTASWLASHTRRAHTGEKPHKCSRDGCEDAFVTSAELASHTARMHERELSVACASEGCRERFVSNQQMYKHVRAKHPGQRVHKCSTCGATSADSSALKTHTRLHTNEKPFACTEADCGVAFRQKTHLATHRFYYHTTQGQAMRKRKEERVAEVLRSADIAFDREYYVDLRSIGATCARVDFRVAAHGCVLLLEVDEKQHTSWDYTCDIRRMTRVVESMTLAGNTSPVVFIRYNPDAFVVDGSPVRVQRGAREAALVEVLRSYTATAPQAQLVVQYMFYDVRNGRVAALAGTDSEAPAHFAACCVTPICA
jgi:hypothetical protein